MEKRVTGIGGIFFKSKDPGKKCLTVWGPFKDDTSYFTPSKKEGVTIVGEVEEFEYGKFGWIMDPEGNKIELREPVDGPLLEQWVNATDE